MKWAVAWVLVSMCPYSPPPEPDEFGRVSLMYTDCVYRLKECGRAQHVKRFNSKAEAQAFYERALKESENIILSESKIVDVKMYEEVTP